MSDMNAIRLPLWALEKADACELGERVAAFERHHGHAPGDTSTWAEWCAVTHGPEDRILDVGRALPLVYPGHQRALLGVVVEAAHLAASRAQIYAAYSPASREALTLVWGWRKGQDVPAAVLQAAAQAAGYAGDAALASSRAAAAVSRAAAAASQGRAIDATLFAAAASAAAVSAAAYIDLAYPGRDTRPGQERAEQWADLDRLLLALNLEAS